MAKKIKEVNQETIEARVRIDIEVEAVKGINVEIEEFEALYKERLKKLEEQYQEKKMNLEIKKTYHMDQIAGLFDLAEATETKTQFKLNLLSGDVVKKKPNLKYEPNKAMLLEWARENDKELVKTKVVEDLDWLNLKARLVMQQDLEGHTVALDTLTGEVLQGVEVVEVEAKMEVK